MILRARDIFLAVIKRGLFIAVLFVLYVVIGIVMVNWYSVNDSIQLDSDLWNCEALDPADGECAVYVKSR